MIILGINAYHGDAAAAIIRDGKLIAAVEEERFNRFKHCAGFPIQAIKYCLDIAAVSINDVDHIGISRDPSAHLHKKILFAATRAARQAAGGGWLDQERRGDGATGRKGDMVEQDFDISLDPVLSGAVPANVAVSPTHPVSPSQDNGNGGPGIFRQIKDRLSNAAKVRDLKDELARQLQLPTNQIRAQFHNIEHHRAHLASAFFVSPFENAALLSIDGFGDFISTMWGVGTGNSIEVLGQVEYPHSAGIVYTATTQFLGFPHYGDEGKVMGLAPYGQPRFIEEFRNIIKTAENGQFRLNLDYFRHHAEGVEMTWDKGSPAIGRIFSDEFVRTFGPARTSGTELTDREKDIAASLQLRLEEVAYHLLNHVHERTGLTDLGLAGGVAYNSVMNGKILLHTPFRRIFIQPAAGDSGTALGVCYQIYNGRLQQRRRQVMEGAYTGPEFSTTEIKRTLDASELKYEEYSDREVTQRAAKDIADGLVVGWFQGRMEFGPRALGNRSILVDPRRAEMKDILNDRVKKRESFRPFAPSILEERVGDYFEQTHPAPTMLMVYQIKEERRHEIPAVTHVDGSGRLQTVSRQVNERYYQLISDFNDLTGVPVILNTSFNENEPIVCKPQEAIECFLKTRMDVLYLGNLVVRRG
ncbi:MAG TPA: carbamoyltransferase C-terminal domain-containing protein [Pyrinomonadaceae bacterium]|jgi:carbamoyltransferase|nr:carbamoyltransferase C-terminal domain-containing protein [Pyrinomonadaceae bacterium]